MKDIDVIEELDFSDVMTSVFPPAGLAGAPLRDSLIDALLRGDNPAEIRARAEHRVLTQRLAAMRAMMASAGDEIASHVLGFIATTDRFALAIERMKTLPEEIASAPALLTEVCDGLARIAAIGLELSRATHRESTYPRCQSTFAPPR
jgi:hypothetical protein